MKVHTRAHARSILLRTVVGKIKVDENVHVDLDAMRKENKDLEEGGHFRPLNCTPQSSVKNFRVLTYGK